MILMIEVVRWSEALEEDVQVLSDGQTCWVNDGSGHCIGRWTPRGVDIHRTLEAQLSGKGQCLDCTPHGSWPYFLEAMERHYGVEIPRTLIDERYR